MLAQPQPSSFSSLVHDPVLLHRLGELGIVNPTPVQMSAIPAALAGSDLIVQAKTGSGKTLAFVIPLLAHLERRAVTGITFAIIITPTRELATQICYVINSVSAKVEAVCLIGGVSISSQLHELKRDRRVLVGTPGRILDLIRQREILLRKCEYFVVDEADEMFSMDFVEEVRAILSRLPDRRQGLFVSATITPRVEALANSFLSKPERIIINTPGEELPSIEHCYFELSGDLTAKPSVLCDLIETQRPASAIIFCNTKSETELVEAVLRRRGFDARLINSDLNQRQRDYIMSKIRAQELQFLVGTDIAARGLDIEQLDLVVNYSISDQAEVYVHRTGRTGRAGRSGRAISLVGPQDFAAFYNLRKTVSIELKQLPLPTEAEVVSARLVHLYEIMRTAKGDVQARDLLLAKKLLMDLGGISEPSDELEGIVAKFARFMVEHCIEPHAISLEEEMHAEAQGGRSHERSPDEGRASGGGSRHRSSRHSSGGRGGRGGRNSRGSRGSY